MPFIVTDIQIESNQIELQACESKSNRIVKFVSIPSPSLYSVNMFQHSNIGSTKGVT